MAFSPDVTFEAFREDWLTDVTSGSPSTLQLGSRFSQKLVTQWLDVGDESIDLINCDGSGDGGIDVAFLDQGDEDSGGDATTQGHTWFLVQSKYGSAFNGPNTLLQEGQKLIDTLDGKRARLSSLAEGLLERVLNFKAQASDSDRLVLVFATELPLNAAEQRVLADLRAMGRNRLGPLFDVEAISIETIFRRLQEQLAEEPRQRLSVSMKASLVQSGNDLLVGSIALTELYRFLKTYRSITNDLDQLYEKNVRRFLGGRGKVNKGIQGTLRDAPERFGLYNNGITIVVSDYEDSSPGETTLIEPYVVNGCQTTKTIWEVFHQKLDAGGTGDNPEMDEWRDRASKGVVVVKVAKVGSSGETLLQAITRYTNSQNAVREKDFLALIGDFRTWQQELGEQTDLYLEIQRGGWDSRRAFQKQKPGERQYSASANSADLIKVYGSGWLGEPGTAFGKNAPFLPNGSVFRRIVNEEGVTEGDPFGSTDLYAAYLLQQIAQSYGFGRGADKPTRRQSRFLFYMVVITLLKDVLSRTGISGNHRSLSHAIIRLASPDNATARDILYDQAVEVIDAYFTQGTDNCVYDEPTYVKVFNSNLNGFLKWEQLGKTEESCPRFRHLLAVNNSTMTRRINNVPARELIAAAIRNGHVAS